MGNRVAFRGFEPLHALLVSVSKGPTMRLSDVDRACGLS